MRPDRKRMLVACLGALLLGALGLLASLWVVQHPPSSYHLSP